VTLASTKILGVQRLAPLFAGPELYICAASVLPEIWCIIRFFPPRLAIWNAFCCCFQVVVRGSSHGEVVFHLEWAIFVDRLVDLGMERFCVCVNSVIEGLTLLTNFESSSKNSLKEFWFLPQNRSRRALFDAKLPDFFKLVISKTAANTLKALGNKIGVMHHSHLRLCVLDAVFFASEQFCAGTFWLLFTESNSERACIRAAWVWFRNPAV